MTYRDCQLINAVAALATTADTWGVIERSIAFDNNPPVLFTSVLLGERVARLANVEPDTITEDTYFFPLDVDNPPRL